MLEVAVVAFTTLFATIGPLDLAPLLAALTPGYTLAQRRSIALRATLIAAIILLIFAVFGHTLLALMGISLPALRTAGGILLLILSIDLVFAKEADSSADKALAEHPGHDIAAFPLATPLIAGPGTMGAVILLMANQSGDLMKQLVVVAALLAVLGLTLGIMIRTNVVLKR